MKELEIKWCPTKEMVADFMTKPLQGSHFRRLRDLIMGTTSIKKAKIPSKSTVTVTKRDTQQSKRPLSILVIQCRINGNLLSSLFNGHIKVRALKRRQTAVQPASPTSAALLAQ